MLSFFLELKLTKIRFTFAALYREFIASLLDDFSRFHENQVQASVSGEIGKCVPEGESSIISRNSFVNRVIPPYRIATGRSVGAVRRR